MSSDLSGKEIRDLADAHRESAQEIREALLAALRGDCEPLFVAQDVRPYSFAGLLDLAIKAASEGRDGDAQNYRRMALNKAELLESRVDVGDAEREALYERVTAFAGQIQARGYADAAKELITEVLGGKVDAPDYYVLKERCEKAEAKLGEVKRVCVDLASAIHLVLLVIEKHAVARAHAGTVARLRAVMSDLNKVLGGER